MRYIFLVFFSLFTFFGFGQSVTAPEPKSFTINTAAQNASGFSLSGFNSTATLLCAIGLPTAPTGTTFYFTTTTGVTAATGYTMSGNKTRLAFTGTQANINNVLASMKVNTSATAGTIQISVSATVNPTGYFYNPTNGHFYRPISTGANFANAITLSSQQTFKGQTGYLVTITSADEDNFIFNNVPQSNIWFAADDRVTEGRWVISAGPEIGTLLRIGNGGGINQQGVYNNWAPGEPNNWGGNEDAAVTKWNGSQWNDLSTANVNPYVVEFGTWTNPDDQTFTEFYSNSVNHSNGNVLRTEFDFNFGNVVDETKFKSKIRVSTDNVTFTTNNPLVALNGLGRVNLTSQIDVQQIGGSGFKASTTGGQVEWCVIYDYDASNQRYQILIDKREFSGTNVSANNVTNLQLFDLWNGPVTFQWDDGTWAAYWIYTPTQLNFAGSSFAANIRRASFFWGLSAEFTFGANLMNKYHKVSMDITQSDLNSLLGSAVTVGDVYLAFREFADKGILGDESKYFTSGIQFDNADVNEDGVFDERDCYSLLTHLQGTTSLWSATPTLGDAMKLIPSTTFDNITKQNWNTYGNLKSFEYPFTFTNGILNAYSLDVSWKGDVNLSHSSQPTGFVASANSSVNEIKSMSVFSKSSVGDVEADIMMEKVGDSVIATIIVNPNGNQIGATQFDVYFDNSILEYTSTQSTTSQSSNFSRNNGSFISVGSLNTSGGTISNIGYKITFKPKITVTNVLGLISVKSVETLNTSLNKINIKVI